MYLETHLQPLVAADAADDEHLLAAAVRHRPLRRLHKHREQRLLQPDILFLKHACSILRQSSNPVCGFSMMEQVRLCAV